MAKKPSTSKAKRSQQLKTRSRALTAAQREKRRDDALKLALAGMSTRDIAVHPEFIARHGHYSHMTVAKDITLLLERKKQDSTDAQRLRQIRIAQLESLLYSWLPKAKKDLHALDRARALINDLARFEGTHMPSRIALGGDKESGPIQIETKAVSQRKSQARADLKDLSFEQLVELRKLRDRARELLGDGVSEAQIIDITEDVTVTDA